MNAQDATGTPKPRLRRRFLDWMGVEGPKLLSAVVVLVLGYWIKDSVDLSIKQRQLDLSYAKEMQALLLEMGKSGAGSEQLEATAVVLSSYGEAALPALMNELRYTGLRADAAAVGLSSLSLTRPHSICAVLPRVLTNRGRQFDWNAHLCVVRLLGEGECIDSMRTLREYREIVIAAKDGDPARFAELVKEMPRTANEAYGRLLDEISRSLQLLEQDRSKTRWSLFPKGG